jgi:hypothetical protein
MNSIAEWESYEHSYTEHSNDWYWIVGIISVASCVLAIFFQNYIFGILILVSGATLGIMAWRKPAIVDIRVTPRGIIVGDLQYEFQKFNSFWIEDDHMHGPRILLHPKSSILPLAVIMIGDEADPEEVKEVLSEYLDLVPLRESALHRLFDYIGF